MSRKPRTDAPTDLITELADRYRSALAAGDRARASALIGDGLAAGLEAVTLLSEVLAPAQRELGRLWRLQRLTIAEEHHGTEITRAELERIRRARRPDRPLGTLAVVCAAPGEVHSLAAHFVATGLECQGWEVDLLGEAPPADQLVAYVRKRRSRLVALSVTLADSLAGVPPLLRALGTLDPRPALLVGGAGVAGLAPADLGADAVAEDVVAGLRFTAGLVASPPPPDLPAYLAAVGRRIHSQRVAAGLSQAGLAVRSGLTRPYLGAIERGRQNFTLEAAHRIAGALGVSLTHLLAQEAS